MKCNKKKILNIIHFVIIILYLLKNKDNELHINYEINDIIINNEHNNPNIIEYNISVCPIYAFVLEKNKVYIANQYMIKFENKTSIIGKQSCNFFF